MPGMAIRSGASICSTARATSRAPPSPLAMAAMRPSSTRIVAGAGSAFQSRSTRAVTAMLERTGLDGIADLPQPLGEVVDHHRGHQGQAPLGRRHHAELERVDRARGEGAPHHLALVDLVHEAEAGEKGNAHALADRLLEQA